MGSALVGLDSGIHQPFDEAQQAAKINLGVVSGSKL